MTARQVMARSGVRSALLVLAAVCLTCPAHAIDPNRTIAQYIRERWGVDRGFPGGSVTAITQTKDGYLWIGTDKGLVRFDGSSFRTFRQAAPTALEIGPVQSLVADAQGNLWVLLQSTQILRYYDGKFEVGHDEAQFGITAALSLRDGSLLLSSLALGLLRYEANVYRAFTASGPVSASPNDTLSSRFSSATGVATHRFVEPDSAVISMAEAPDGTVWLGTRDKGFFSARAGSVQANAKKLPSPQVNSLLAVSSGDLWIGTNAGLVRMEANTDVPPALRDVPILSMVRDRDANEWVGTPKGRGPRSRGVGAL
jgi:ligand-binding sensor domain-containing protein